jgi:hypothetical protein
MNDSDWFAMVVRNLGGIDGAAKAQTLIDAQFSGGAASYYLG